MEIQELQKLRKLGLTYEQIGEKFGVSRQRIWQILNNYSNISKLNTNKFYELKRNTPCELGIKCFEKNGFIENRYYKLEIHHKDKNRDNNDLANLLVLCIGCHKYIHSKYR